MENKEADLIYRCDHKIMPESTETIRIEFNEKTRIDRIEFSENVKIKKFLVGVEIYFYDEYYGEDCSIREYTREKEIKIKNNEIKFISGAEIENKLLTLYIMNEKENNIWKIKRNDFGEDQYTEWMEKHNNEIEKAIKNIQKITITVYGWNTLNH